MKLEQLDKQFEEFKKEYTYQYLKHIGEKLKKITYFSQEHNPKGFQNYEYHFHHIMISVVEQYIGSEKTFGLNFKFCFVDKEDNKDKFSFTTYHKKITTFNVDIHEKILKDIDDIYQLFHDVKKNDLYLLLTEHFQQIIANSKKKMVIFNVAYDPEDAFKFLLGPQFYARYEKEQLESSLSTQVNPCNIKKLKV